MPCIIPNFNRFFERLDYYGWPLLLLGIRFWMAYVFWRSGRIKLKHWDSTLSLFQFEYKVPFIAPDLAAYFATGFELICPLLLVAGFMARLATIPLLVITAVIQLTYVSHHDHLYWGFLLGVILLKGAGPLSLDALWCKWP
jgi:putative oxidoreductase